MEEYGELTPRLAYSGSTRHAQTVRLEGHG
jgi:hypothetical protein